MKHNIVFRASYCTLISEKTKKKILARRYSLDEREHIHFFFISRKVFSRSNFENTNVFRRKEYALICNFESIL